MNYNSPSQPQLPTAGNIRPSESLAAQAGVARPALPHPMPLPPGQFRPIMTASVQAIRPHPHPRPHPSSHHASMASTASAPAPTSNSFPLPPTPVSGARPPMPFSSSPPVAAALNVRPHWPSNAALSAPATGSVASPFANPPPQQGQSPQSQPKLARPPPSPVNPALRPSNAQAPPFPQNPLTRPPMTSGFPQQATQRPPQPTQFQQNQQSPPLALHPLPMPPSANQGPQPFSQSGPRPPMGPPPMMRPRPQEPHPQNGALPTMPSMRPQGPPVGSAGLYASPHRPLGPSNPHQPPMPQGPFNNQRPPLGPNAAQRPMAPVGPTQMPPINTTRPFHPTTMSHIPPLSQAPVHFQQPHNPQLHQQPYNPQMGSVAAAPMAPPPPKVNPASIPSVVSVLEADEMRFRDSSAGAQRPYLTFTSIQDIPPPLPTSRSVTVIDDGNSAPQFIRATVNHIPATEDLAESSKIPVALLLQPFALGPHQLEVPLVGLDDCNSTGTTATATGPLRCNRCRAYINPHVQFIKGGRFFVCNFCGLNNEVPDEYYANLDMAGKRIDLDSRPELKYGTVDFLAPKDYYNNKTPGKPYILFALDGSRAAINSGSFNVAVETIKAFVSNPASTELYAGLGIMVYDRTITLYTLRPSATSGSVSNGNVSIHSMVMTDVADPFIPLPASELYFNFGQCGSGLEILLNHLLQTYSTEAARIVDSCFGSACQVAWESLKVRGGRAIFFQSILPSVGLGALKNREAAGASDATLKASADKAHPLLHPQGDFYTKLGKQAAEGGVSFSLILSPSSHCDLTSIGEIVNLSGGRVFYAPKTGSRLISDVSGWLSTDFAFDCLARVRCGSGLQVRRHYGHLVVDGNGHDISFGAMAADQAFAAFLEYDGKLSINERCSFQLGCLYTHARTGQRRIRVINLSLPVTNQMSSIFRMAELDSILAFYLKKNVSQILEAPAAAFSASFTAKCVNILAAYRKHCASGMSAGQLILPDSLKLFPIMTLVLCKTPAFSPSQASLSADARWNAIHRLTDLSMALTVPAFYPQLFPLDPNTLLQQGEVLPACIRCSREHLRRDALYLACDGSQLILYVGDGVEASILKDIFGVEQLNAINTGFGHGQGPINASSPTTLINHNPYNQSSSNNHILPVLNNPLSAKIRQIVTTLRGLYAPRPLNLRMIRQSVDIAEDAEFNAQVLVEDASAAGASYVDFLCRVHSQIQNVMTQGASALSLAERTSLLSFMQ